MKKSVVILFVVLIGSFVLILGSAKAGKNVWSQIGLAGAAVTALHSDPNDVEVIYSGTRDEGLYKSIDGGANWERIGKGNPHLEDIGDIEIDPNNSDVVYVAPSSEPLQKSTNGGKDWVTLDLPSSYRVTVSPVDSSLVLVGAEGIWRSTDSGEIWKQIPGSPVNIWAIEFAPSKPNVVYVAALEAGVWKSVDSGKTWQEQNGGFIVPPLAWSVAVDPVDSELVFMGTSDGLFRSHNGGKDWEVVGSGLTSSDIRSIEIDRLNRKTIYVGAGSGLAGVYRSLDSGDSWMPMMEGMGSKFVFEICSDVNRNVFSATTSGIWKYTDTSNSLFLPIVAGK